MFEGGKTQPWSLLRLYLIMRVPGQGTYVMQIYFARHGESEAIMLQTISNRGEFVHSVRPQN